MSSAAYFSSVPGIAVPGMSQPGLAAQYSGTGPYQYIGEEACYYLDYLDVATGHTLAPVPGGYYTMQVANPRYGLTVPPPGRPWFPGSAGPGGTFAPSVIRLLSAAEQAAAVQRSLILHGHYPGVSCGHCDPEAPHRLPPPRRSGDPVSAPVRHPVIPPASAVHGHYPGVGCGHCDPLVRDRLPPPRKSSGPVAALALPVRPRPGPDITHGHYPGASCGHCDPEAARRPPAPRQSDGPRFAQGSRPAKVPLPPPVTHGHYPGVQCGQCNPSVRDRPPPPRRSDGPDVSVQPTLAMARAALEESRVAHGHYAPGGCKVCMGGG